MNLLALQLGVLGNVVIACLLGALVGVEREVADKPAGLRTHMLVAGSAALFVALGNIIVNELTFRTRVTSDPIRIIEAVVVGISFLGAGTILRRESADKVKGLTTAASILVVAGVGIAVAVNMLVIAVGVTGIVLVVNRLIGLVESRLKEKIEKELAG